MDYDTIDAERIDEQAICIGFLLRQLLLANGHEDILQTVAWRDEIVEECQKLCDAGVHVSLESVVIRLIQDTKVTRKKFIGDFEPRGESRFLVTISAEVTFENDGTIKPGGVEISLGEIDNEMEFPSPYPSDDEPVQ